MPKFRKPNQTWVIPKQFFLQWLIFFIKSETIWTHSMYDILVRNDSTTLQNVQNVITVPLYHRSILYTFILSKINKNSNMLIKHPEVFSQTCHFHLIFVSSLFVIWVGGRVGEIGELVGFPTFLHVCRIMGNVWNK